MRYIETRSENMVAMTHGRAQVQDVQLGAKRDGTITGLKLRVVQDVGAYPQGGAFLPELTRMMASGVYAIPRADVEDVCVVTNTTPLDAYRGAGRPEAAAMIERAVDMLADELGMDRVDVRRKNLIPPFDRTHETVTEAKYDVGNYELALDAALEGADYAALRADQAERRARGDRRQLGIGVSVYVEVTGFGKEFGSVEVHEDGSATIRTGTSPHGQGHETAFAQLASGVLRIPFDKITVLHSDTSLLPRGDGTMGSRSLQLGGSAIHRAGEEVVEKARLVAAHMLEASPADVELTEDGTFAIAGAPERSVDWPQIATTAADASALPEGVEPGLAAQNLFDAGGTSFPFGAHVAVVEVDVETGDARLVRFVAVDDCGRILNPMLAEGQVHGGLTQGAAQALYEGVEYDDQGNPLTGTLMSYGMPSAAELISLGDDPHADAHVPQPVGRQGDRRVGHHRLDAGRPERGRGRRLTPGRAPHRHAADARTGLARNPRGAGRAGDATRVTTLERFDDPRAFRSVAEPFLMRDEARHNLQLGICRRLEWDPHAFGGDPPYLSVAVADGEVVAVAIRTPPFHLLVSTTRLAAVDAIADDVRERFAGLPGILALPETSAAFADAWSARSGQPAWTECRSAFIG